MFRNKEYTDDGYRLLEIRCDRVERIPAEVPGHEQSVGHHADNHQQTTQSLSNPAVSDHPFLRPGNRVIVSKGHVKGMKGAVDQLSNESALITLEDENNQNIRKSGSVQVEVALSSITRLFELGETVKVGAGKHLGRFGVVADVEGSYLTIVDWARNEAVLHPHLLMTFL